MQKPNSRVLSLFALPVLAGLLTGCNREPEPRHYREVITRGEVALQGKPRIDMTWTLPAHWTVQPEGDPLRLTGFWAPDPARAAAGKTDPNPVDVSIVQLAGAAGGLEANVTRWLGQVKIAPSFTQQAIEEATPIRLASGQEGIIVDFTGLLSGDLTQTESIMGAIVPVGETTLFVKAMGGRSRLQRLKPELIAFCQSLSVGSASVTGETAP